MVRDIFLHFRDPTSAWVSENIFQRRLKPEACDQSYLSFQFFKKFYVMLVSLLNSVRCHLVQIIALTRKKGLAPDKNHLLSVM